MRYEAVAALLQDLRPQGDYVLSLCNWGTADVRTWGKEVGNSWRTSSDIMPGWSSMLHNFDSAADRSLYAGPGHWNDADILSIGQGEFDADHVVEARSEFSLWAMLSAPLLISYDLGKLPPSLFGVVSNASLIRIDQDAAGNQAIVAYDSEDAQILVKTLGDGGAKAVALFNRAAAPVTVNLLARHLKFSGTAPIVLRDLWSNASIEFAGERKFTLGPHETRVFEARGERLLRNGVYVSEIPGSLNVAVDGTRRAEPDPTIYRMMDPWADTHAGSARPQYAGWGGARADATPFDQALEVAGRRFLSGIGILSNSRIEIKNQSGFSRLEVSVGVDDSTPNVHRAVRFEVYGDGKRLAGSAALAYGDAPTALTADIRGLHVIELIARSKTRADEMPVVVTWGEARLMHD